MDQVKFVTDLVVKNVYCLLLSVLPEDPDSTYATFSEKLIFLTLYQVRVFIRGVRNVKKILRAYEVDDT